VKNNLIGDVEERLVRYLSETYPGRIHDKRICDEEEPVFPAVIGLFHDTGFQGRPPKNGQKGSIFLPRMWTSSPSSRFGLGPNSIS